MRACKREALAPAGPMVVLALTLAAALAGCGAQYASSDPAFPDDFAERHPIALVSAPTTLDVYARGGRLDQRTAANLRAFAARYRAYGSGGVVILRPAAEPADARAVEAVRRALAAGGAGRIDVLSYAADAGVQGARRRSASPSRGSRPRSRSHAGTGPTTSPRAPRSKAGATSPTPISAAPRRRCWRPRSTIRATSPLRARPAPPTRRCACGRSRRCARVRTRAHSGRPISPRSAGASDR